MKAKKLKNTKKKISRTDLKKQTQIDMAKNRKRDTANLRKKTLRLIETINTDLTIINKTMNKLNEQIFSLEAKKIKSEGALTVLNLLLEDSK